MLSFTQGRTVVAEKRARHVTRMSGFVALLAFVGACSEAPSGPAGAKGVSTLPTPTTGAAHEVVADGSGGSPTLEYVAPNGLKATFQGAADVRQYELQITPAVAHDVQAVKKADLSNNVGTVNWDGLTLGADYTVCLKYNATSTQFNLCTTIKALGPAPVNADHTAPVITANVSGTEGLNGWFTSDVAVTWTVTDPESAVTTQGCDAVTLASETNAKGTAVTCTATSAGGTASSSETVKIDKSVPVIPDATVPAVDGSNGWYRSDVAFSWTPSDLQSGISSSTGCGASVSGDTKGQSFTCSATDSAGLSNSSQTVVIKRDATKPVIGAPHVSGVQGTNGWYTSAVSVSFDYSDATSGVAGNSGCSATFGDDGVGYSTTCTVTDAAGNEASLASDMYKKDGTAPQVTYTGNAGIYAVDQTVAITCNATDNLSGVASKTCPNIGGPAYTFSLNAANNYSGSATDNAGNVGAGNTAFTVQVTADGVCGLTKRWISNAGVANSLCVKLTNAAAAKARGDVKAHDNLLGAYANEVKAQTGKMVTADSAAWLLRFVAML